MLGDGQYGIYDRQLAQDIARHFRQLSRTGIGRGNMEPFSYVPIKATSTIERGRLVRITGIDGNFDDDADVDRYKEFVLFQGTRTGTDDDQAELGRLTFGVSISEMEEGDCGAVIVNGPVAVECQLGSATVSNVGNYIVPFYEGDGKAEIRPYGVGKLMLTGGKLQGVNWVRMGQQKLHFKGKTSGAWDKGDPHTVAVYWGIDKGLEVATGMTQTAYNTFDDITGVSWVRCEWDYGGFEVVNAECTA